MKLSLKQVRQRENHTCGLCASRVVYRHFKLKNKHLRKAMQVDEPALPLTDWEGTLPWDMLRTFRNDGFVVDALAPDFSSFRKVINRLERGHPAVVLLGPLWGLHWVVIGGYDAKKRELLIVDSTSDTKSGWRTLTKEEALHDFLLIFSIRGNDGVKRECSTMELMWEVTCIVPELFKLGSVLPNSRDLPWPF